MVVRDVDVLGHAATRAEVGVAFSIPTLDLEVWRRTEPGTAPPARRLRAIRTLIDAGIEASVGMADPARPCRTIRRRWPTSSGPRDMRATSVWTNVLFLRPGTREHFLEHLARDWPGSCRCTSGCTAGAPTSRRTSWSPARSPQARARARHRRPTNTADPPDPEVEAAVEQLSLRLEPRAA